MIRYFRAASVAADITPTTLTTAAAAAAAVLPHLSGGSDAGS